MSFHFSGNETTPQNVIENLQRLSPFSPQQIGTFTSVLLSFLASGNANNLIEALKGFSGENNVSFGVLKNVAQAELEVLKGSFQNNLTSAQLSEDLSQLGWNADNVAVVSRLWKDGRETLSASSLGDTLMVNKLILPEWRFGITTANKELREVGTTFLQLKLILDGGDGKTKEEYIELSLPQFYEFVATLEKAKAQMEFFS
eukprot:TRINITY_DN3711_c0_g1_i1.p1 TRINITY_DN3711_c0_g1~~TRINITY_DN3711_c0_g1_i1.p1  ORF type:complete len:220 (-),score=58.70 TRINITY_DN3711_c0_g1_i1:56-658(-)